MCLPWRPDKCTDCSPIFFYFSSWMMTLMTFVGTAWGPKYFTRVIAWGNDIASRWLHLYLSKVLLIIICELQNSLTRLTNIASNQYFKYDSVVWHLQTRLLNASTTEVLWCFFNFQMVKSFGNHFLWGYVSVWLQSFCSSFPSHSVLSSWR